MSEAAREASRRNGAKSGGPKTQAGKRTSARNALRHGLRATNPIEPATTPPWARRIKGLLGQALVHVGQTRREHFDRYIQSLVLIDQTDRLIAEEFARLLAADPEEKAVRLRLSQAGEPDFSRLKTLLGYRRRFRAARDRCVIKLATQGPRMKQLRAAAERAGSNGSNAARTEVAEAILPITVE